MNRVHFMLAVVAVCIGVARDTEAAPRGAPAAFQREQLQGGRSKQIVRQGRPVPLVLQSTFEIPANEDEVVVPLQVEEPGLHSVELNYRCDDLVRKHDRITLSIRSAVPATTSAGKLGAPKVWFGRAEVLNPETGYRFYFWIDETMLQEIGAAGTLQFVLGRVDRQRSRMEGEFEARRRVTVALPRLLGRIHFRLPSPIAVEATLTDPPASHPVASGSTEVLQYRVSVRFPPLAPRSVPRQFKAEFRVQRNGRNEDIGGVLLRNGRWQSPGMVKESGTYDFLASPLTEFAKDSYGRRRLPAEEDWVRFKHEGLLVELTSRQPAIAAAVFYIYGGDVPPDYYVVELEEIRLGSVPDEGDGVFWLRLNSAAAVANPEGELPSENPFASESSSESVLAQSLQKRIAVPPSGETKGIARVRLPLLVLPFSGVQSQRRLHIGTDPHYFHEMPALEQGKYVLSETGGSDFLVGLISQNPQKLAEGIVTFLTRVGKARNPDLYRTFGMDALETDSARGWALQNDSIRFVAEGESSRDVGYKEVYGPSNRSLATVSARSPGAGGRWHGSTLRIRKVPGIDVQGAKIRVLNVKANREFRGYIHVYLGIAGHDGGRTRTSGAGLRMESSAVGSPWSHWVYTVTERGPFDLRPGAVQAIDFTTIDFSNPDRTPEGLWEQLSHTFGPWAALHIQVTLDKARGKTVDPADEGYFTIYPYDYVLGQLKGSTRREGEWIILNGTLPVHSHILDEVGLEVRLKVNAREVPILIRQTTRN